MRHSTAHGDFRGRPRSRNTSCGRGGRALRLPSAAGASGLGWDRVTPKERWLGDFGPHAKVGLARVERSQRWRCTRLTGSDRPTLAGQPVRVRREGRSKSITSTTSDEPVAARRQVKRSRGRVRARLLSEKPEVRSAEVIQLAEGYTGRTELVRGWPAFVVSNNLGTPNRFGTSLGPPPRFRIGGGPARADSRRIKADREGIHRSPVGSWQGGLHVR